jgi:uncharacterized membrane protein YcaP (DUF421 family)
MPAFTLSGTDVLGILFRSLVVYVVVLGGMRIMGKREMGQLAPFDLVMILLIANAVQNAMVGSDTSLLGGIVAAVALFSANWLVGFVASKSERFERFIVGKPTLLVNDGRVLEENMRRENVTMDELKAALHEHGIGNVSEVSLAMLEIDGDISMVARDSTDFRRYRRRVRQVKHGT